MSASAPPPVDLRRKALLVLFWFVALSLLFNSLFGDMGLIQGYRQRRLLARLQHEVRTLHQVNDRLAADIADLRHDPYRIEQIAREELGLSRPGEILFLFQEPEPGDSPPPER
jgi:cell division protein FtsB